MSLSEYRRDQRQEMMSHWILWKNNLCCIDQYPQCTLPLLHWSIPTVYPTFVALINTHSVPYLCCIDQYPQRTLPLLHWSIPTAYPTFVALINTKCTLPLVHWSIPSVPYRWCIDQYPQCTLPLVHWSIPTVYPTVGALIYTHCVLYRWCIDQYPVYPTVGALIYTHCVLYSCCIDQCPLFTLPLLHWSIPAVSISQFATLLVLRSRLESLKLPLAIRTASAERKHNVT